MLSIFYISVDHLYVFIREMSVQVLCLFFKLGYLFFYWIVRVPYIFWKLITYKIYGFHSVGHLFTLLILHWIEVFKFGVVSHDYLCFCCLCFWLQIHEIIVSTSVFLYVFLWVVESRSPKSKFLFLYLFILACG